MADKLIAYLRDEFKNPHIEYSASLTQLQGGYETAIYHFILKGVGEELSQSLVLRLYPHFYGTQRALWESTVQNVLAGEGFPVAKAHVVCTDLSILGGAFFVMDYLSGQPLMMAPSDTVPALLGETHAALHAIDPQPLISTLHKQGVDDYGYSLNSRFDWLKEKARTLSWIGEGVQWLSDHRPPELGLPTGVTAEQAVKGYFPRKRTRCGHQLVRVTNFHPNEILGHWLFAGTMTSAAVVKATVLEVEQLFALTTATRAHILWRFDAGFGTDANINWLLWRNYQLLGKGFSGKRASKLARSVQHWTPAPSADHTERDVGKILAPIRDGRRTVQWSVRVPTKRGHKYATLITTLDGDGVDLVHQYDLRAGFENRTENDMSGLGLGKRQKKRWPAQQMMMLIVQLAHNLLVWQTSWLQQAELTPQEQRIIKEHGVYRIVHQRLNVDGQVSRKGAKVARIELNPLHPLAPLIQKGFQALLKSFGTRVILGKI